MPVGHSAGPLSRAVRDCVPGSFAVTTATGIVSTALRLAERHEPAVVLLADVLLGIAATSFAVLLAASAAAASPRR